MSRSTCLGLVRSLTLVPPDEGTLDRYYDETLIDIGTDPFLFEATLLPVSLDQHTFTLPDFAVNLQSVWYDDRALDAATLQHMQAISPQWRDAQNQPCTYVTEQETERTFRLFPRPTHPSKDFIFLTGSPFGIDFPSYSVAVLHTTHPSDAPDLLDLMIAHRILAREFSRESQHQDLEYAQRCEILYQLLRQMLRVNHAQSQ